MPFVYTKSKGNEEGVKKTKNILLSEQIVWYFRLPGADREGGDEGAERLPAVPQVTVLHAAVALPVLLPRVLVVGWDEGEESGDGGRPLMIFCMTLMEVSRSSILLPERLLSSLRPIAWRNLRELISSKVLSMTAASQISSSSSHFSSCS